MASRARRRQPRIALPVVVLGVAMVGVGIWTAIGSIGGGGDASSSSRRLPELTRHGSTPVRAARGSTLPITRGPDDYAVTFEVREPGRPTTRETISVVGPFLSRRTNPTEVSETSFGRLAIQPSRGARSIVSPPPSAVVPRPDLVVGRAVDEGLVDAREMRRVAGRRCQVFRSLAPVSSSTISAALPTRHTDTCITGEGIVVEEWQVEDGRPVRQRVAVEVQLGGVDLSPIDEAPTINAGQGGGSVLPVDPGADPEGRFFVLDAPPPGFHLRGRYSVIPPQPGLTDATERRKAVASTADVYERGTDVLIVDRGNTLNLDRAFQPRPEGRPVDLGPLFGQGELLLSWSGPEVRWGDEDGEFVRVYGTVSIDEVLATAKALRATPGGPGLIYLDPPTLEP
ncbi:MAG TPA: hypothetical protein VM143_09840 [Acidimicrobiales bacterium]|nr:hypothetical protein [Acidimicrobiales bacterium]